MRNGTIDRVVSVVNEVGDAHGRGSRDASVAVDEDLEYGRLPAVVDH